MAFWNVPYTYVTGEIVAASSLNGGSDNLRSLENAARCLGGKKGNAADFSTSSATYVDMYGTDVTRRTYTKYGSGTESDLIVVWNCILFRDSAGVTEIRIGVQVDAADSDSWDYGFNVNLSRTPISGWVVVPGIAAGSRGIELRVRVTSGGPVKGAVDDDYGLLVYEVPAALTFA